MTFAAPPVCVSLQGVKPAISKGKKEHEPMIARGGEYEGPVALKNISEGPGNHVDSIKKAAPAALTYP